MSYELGPDGFFTSVNGHPVIKEDVRPQLRVIRPHLGKSGDGTTTYNGGFAHGVLFHYTAGEQNDIAGSMYARGYPTAPFCVGQDGSVRQYLPVNVAGWHAYAASQVYFGIEHTAFPGRLELNDAQLEVSTKLSAALVEYVKEKHGFQIPLVHFPRQSPPNLPFGFRDHIDGSTLDWNNETHTDHLYRWTWDKYLSKVRALVLPPVTVTRYVLTRPDGTKTKPLRLRSALRRAKSRLLVSHDGSTVSIRKVKVT